MYAMYSTLAVYGTYVSVMDMILRQQPIQPPVPILIISVPDSFITTSLASFIQLGLLFVADRPSSSIQLPINDVKDTTRPGSLGLDFK